MRFRLLDASRADEREVWAALWDRWPEREVMAHPEYVSLFARPGDRVVAAVGEEAGGAILLPAILRPLAAERWAAPGEERWDATTPYGYGGPFRIGDVPRDAPEFWRAYEDACRQARVVCTFARLSLFPEQLANVPGRIEDRGPNVFVPLAPEPEAVAAGYDRDVRRRLRVAAREGVQVEVDTRGARLAEFHAIYAHTMGRRGAAAWYQFPLAFFERIVERLAGRFAFVHALVAGRVLSSELSLVSERCVYSFLGGTLEDAFRVYPNEVVRHGTAAWAGAARKQRYVLGGGYAPNDGILRHKQIFAPGSEARFRTACLMHDEVAYFELARRRDEAARASGEAWAPRPEFFPVYRG